MAGDDESSAPKPIPRRPTAEETAEANQRLVKIALESARARVRQLEAENLQLKLEIDELRERLTKEGK